VVVAPWYGHFSCWSDMLAPIDWFVGDVLHRIEHIFTVSFRRLHPF
jgi:hypothetical protein